MRLIIFGSRTLTGGRVERLIEDTIKRYKAEKIVTSGGITGWVFIETSIAERKKIVFKNAIQQGCLHSKPPEKSPQRGSQATGFRGNYQ